MLYRTKQREMLREKLVDLKIASAAATHSGMVENPQTIYERTANEIRELLSDGNAEN